MSYFRGRRSGENVWQKGPAEQKNGIVDDPREEGKKEKFTAYHSHSQQFLGQGEGEAREKAAFLPEAAAAVTAAVAPRKNMREGRIWPADIKVQSRK